MFIISSRLIQYQTNYHLDQQYLLYIRVLQLTLSLLFGVSATCIAKAGVVVVKITKARAVVQRLERYENLLMIIFVPFSNDHFAPQERAICKFMRFILEI